MSTSLHFVIALDLYEQEVELSLDAPNAYTTGSSLPLLVPKPWKMCCLNAQTMSLQKLVYQGEEDGYHVFVLPTTGASFRVPLEELLLQL